MTGPWGNRLTIASPRVSIDRGAAKVNRNFGEAILNLSGQIDLPITLKTSHYLFNISPTPAVACNISLV